MKQLCLVFQPSTIIRPFEWRFVDWNERVKYNDNYSSYSHTAIQGPLFYPKASSFSICYLQRWIVKLHCSHLRLHKLFWLQNSSQHCVPFTNVSCRQFVTIGYCCHRVVIVVLFRPIGVKILGRCNEKIPQHTLLCSGTCRRAYNFNLCLFLSNPFNYMLTKFKNKSMISKISVYAQYAHKSINTMSISSS